MKLSCVHLIIGVLGFSFVLTAYSAKAQSPHLIPRSTPIIVGADNNETWKSEMSYLSQSIGADEPVILIARLGNGEVSRKLSRQRLQLTRLYLHVGRGLEPPLKEENIVVAEGERIRGAGRIEVYVRGKLFMVFKFKRNKNVAPEAWRAKGRGSREAQANNGMHPTANSVAFIVSLDGFGVEYAAGDAGR